MTFTDWREASNSKQKSGNSEMRSGNSQRFIDRKETTGRNETDENAR
jgi:hypothetical protein